MFTAALVYYDTEWYVGDMCFDAASINKSRSINYMYSVYFQTKEFLDRAIGVLKDENQILTNHPNAQIYKYVYQLFNPFPHTTILQQTTTLNKSLRNMENLFKWRNNYWKKLKILLQKVKLLVLSNFPFCHNDFKKSSESVSMRERVKRKKNEYYNIFVKCLWKLCMFESYDNYRNACFENIWG